MALEDAKQAVSEEINRLHKQMTQLEKALGQLDRKGQTRNGARPKPAASKSQRKRSPNGRKRQSAPKRIPGSERQEQIMAIVKTRPGITQGDLAKEAGVTPSYISGIVKTLEGEKKLRRADGGVRRP